MACGAGRRRAMIQTRNAPVDFLGIRMTLGAPHLCVCAFKGIESLTMIEFRRSPFRNRMASRTILLLSRSHELPTVNIFVAFKALFRGCREIHRSFRRVSRQHTGRQGGRVATGASGRLMRPFQRKFGFGMIESAQLPPLAIVVASFARQ